jgi:hypothetical protein
VIGARLTAPIKRKLPGLRDVSPRPGVEGAEFRDQPTRWPHPYRFVVIRRPQPEEPTAQLALFKLGKYHDQVLVTNLPLSPPQPLAVRQRSRRGRVGLIKQLKEDDALGSIPTRHFFANETSCHLLLLAYTLVNWFKRLCLPPEFQNAVLQPLRQRILFMPAQLGRAHNCPPLALPASGYREAAWKYALHKSSDSGCDTRPFPAGFRFISLKPVAQTHDWAI